mgnify:CR=1 FL=1
MNVKRIEQVTNGWVAYDEHNTVIAVATNGEQLVEILNINTKVPDPESSLVYLNMNPNFNSSEFWRNVKADRKIDAIVAFRHAFISEDHGKVAIGLKASKDFVETAIQNASGVNWR